MPITLINPDGLPTIDTYHQVSLASGSRLVFVAGQVAWDANGDTVGAGDLAAQVERCYLNVATALAAADATFADVAKLTVYAVDWTPDKMPHLLTGITRASAHL
ncbi:RidA family protein, partial [Streptomyces boluensis]